MSHETLLAVTNRPNEIVGREDQLSQIEKAIYHHDNKNQIVLITGAGGYGKTRLAEETLRRIGHPGMRQKYGALPKEHDWAARYPNQALSANILDFNDIRLHTRNFFIGQIGASQSWHHQITFNNFESSDATHKRLVDAGAAYTVVRRAMEAAELDFWRDLWDAAENQRLVITLDTTEQLAFDSSEWLVQNNLIRPHEYVFNTHQWLLSQIEEGQFRNTTLIIVGRDEDHAEEYYALLRQAVEKSRNPQPELTRVPVEALTAPQVAGYLTAVKTHLSQSNSDFGAAANDMLAYILEDLQQVDRLVEMSGGQPIRLAMYTDVLVEGHDIPLPLQPTPLTLSLTEARWEIEAEFIKLLFQQSSLRSLILQAVVRARRGLTAVQLHYILDANPQTRAKDWQPNEKRLAEIEAEIKSLLQLSLVKSLSDSRVALQDEVYRIYDEHMVRSEANRQRETAARQRLYQSLLNWTLHERERVRQQRQQDIQHDLAKIKPLPPANILQTQMPAPAEMEQQIRQQRGTMAQHLDLEFLHYNLLLDPFTAFNDVRLSLSNKRINSYNIAADATIYAETWRILKNSFTFQFLPDEKQAGETPESLARQLQLAAQRDDAANWILRFIIQKQYHRAIALAKNIDALIKDSTHEPPDAIAMWDSPFAHAERDCWCGLAHIYLGQVRKGIEKTKPSINTLKANNSISPDKLTTNRIELALANCYNTIGYGHIILGDFRAGSRLYTQAIQHLHALPEAQSQRATVKNNLSRALVEMGKRRAIRVCEESLDQRIKLGELIPIAYSFNTMGLIMNDLNQPYEALQASARALAVARHVDDARVTGLSLIQVAESLRRTVRTSRFLSVEEREAIYEEARRTIDQARQIFLLSSAKNEKVRQIEVSLERGCLYRDWMHFTEIDKLSDTLQPKAQLDSIRKSRQDEAIRSLQQALKDAQALGLERLELDAQVNIAWTYGYALQFDEAKEWLATALQTVKNKTPEIMLKQGGNLPQVNGYPDYIYRQLAKIYGLYGRIAFKQFNQSTEEQPTYLQEAANAYVQALTYAQLFSPSAPALTKIYDAIYSYLAELNPYELRQFSQYEREAYTAFNLNNLKTENLGNLQNFLQDCFGELSETIQDSS